MKNGIIFSIIGFFLFCSISAAQETGSVRAWGMGNAFCAVHDDIDAINSNPAGISELVLPELKVNSGNFVEYSRCGFLSGLTYAWPVKDLNGKSVVGVFVNNKNSPINNSRQLGASFATEVHAFKYPVRLGSNLKWYSNDADSSNYYLLDIGAQTTPKINLPHIDNPTVGLSLRNLFAGNSRFAKATPVAGFSCDTFYDLFASADLSWAAERLCVSLGSEKSFFHRSFLVRAGYLNSSNSYFNFGFSSYLWPVGFDASFSWPVDGKDSSYSQFSIKYRFGAENVFDHVLDQEREIKERIRREAAAKEAAAKPVIAETPKKPVKHVALEPEKSWPKYHTVVQGDTLRQIAKTYYNDPGKWQFIYKANTDKINRGQPVIGSILLIPEP
jgi:LysM repeat protein